MYRCTIIPLYVSVQYVQVHYNTAVYVSVVCTGAISYYSMCQCCMYSYTITLLYVFVHYVQVYNNTAVCVCAVCTGEL